MDGSRRGVRGSWWRGREREEGGRERGGLIERDLWVQRWVVPSVSLTFAGYSSGDGDLDGRATVKGYRVGKPRPGPMTDTGERGLRTSLQPPDITETVRFTLQPL